MLNVKFRSLQQLAVREHLMNSGNSKLNTEHLTDQFGDSTRSAPE